MLVVKDLYKNIPDKYRGLNRNAVKIGVAKAIHNWLLVGKTLLKYVKS